MLYTIIKAKGNKPKGDRMKKAKVNIGGKKVAEVRVFDNGYEMSGEHGYKFYFEHTSALAAKTLRRHATEYASMYLTGSWDSEVVSLGRLTKCVPC